MNFQFDEDQDLLRDAAQKLLGDKATLEAAHKHMDKASDYDKELWSTMAENGWQGIAIPEEFGGAGMSYLDLSVLAEELGYHYAHTPFSASIFGAAEAIIVAGSSEQKSTLLPKIANGETIGTLAVFEQSGRHDYAGITTKAVGGKLSGIKLPVSDGLCADIAIVAAQADKGLSLYVVDLTQAGVERAELRTMELTRKQATLTLNNAQGELLGEEGQGEALLDNILNRTAILTAFEQLGGAQRCLDMAKDYSLERYCFGRQIGSYQAIKHRIADMYVKVEMARSNCYFGAWALTSSEADIPEAAAVSRIAVCDAYSFAAQENIQIHGGIGFTWDANPHLFLKRMKMQEFSLGSANLWKEKLYKALANKAA
ncbi:MAG: acyl-CoA/acyl-ACP dehydrogenase [Pseudomonadales bacterium]|nr:acyl-CoA/acyl-ACP dehydrogenase [Pseudomonadales bacterium]